MVVEVSLPLPLDQTFSYAVPEELTPGLAEGVRVLVPFGSRFLTGVIVHIGSGLVGGAALKPIKDVLDERPSVTGEMLRLTKWIADYYVCSWGEALRAALPPGADVESRQVVLPANPAVRKAEDPVEAKILEHVAEVHELTVRSLQRSVPRATLARLKRMEAAGMLELRLDMRGERVRIKREPFIRLTPGTDASDVVAALRGVRQVAVVDVLARAANEGEGWMRQRDVLASASADAATVKRLLDRGMVERAEREVVRVDAAVDPTPPAVERAPHPSQERALSSILQAVGEGAYASFLLHGVTGSGKTEVYIDALKATLARGRTGIVLVPEIALTPQTVGRFRAHFGEQVAVLHSRMGLGERYDAWRHLRDGRYRVAIGPRSAVLAPMSDLGLIVVDEEHESSYKQFDPAPRYHARDVAVMRAHLNRAVCVLGSATPSLESWVNASESSKYRLIQMKERVPVADRPAAALPEVSIVDLVKERKRHRLDGTISTTLLEAIAACVARREQVILLQNRRGFAPVVECMDCGWVPQCPDCSVSLTYHKARRHLKCHYCGRTRRLPSRCEACSSSDLGQLGAGTQRVEEELLTRLPDVRVLRMDQDTTSRKRSHHRILERFRRGQAEVLLGTQMVAKGLDFPNVTLVGVVNADTSLLLPDFRAEERTFQLLTQVAGRAGRAALPGRVILQTRNADAAVLALAMAHDYEGFAASALPERRDFQWPPYVRLVVVEFRGPDEARALELARGWTSAIRERAPDLQIHDPVPALVSRVKRQHRFRTIIKSPRARVPEVQEAIRAAHSAFGAVPSDYRVSVDVDAVEAI